MLAVAAVAAVAAGDNSLRSFPQESDSQPFPASALQAPSSYFEPLLAPSPHMHAVQDAVEDGSEEQGNGGEEGDAAVEGVGGREELGGIVREGVDRAHAPEDHRGVEESVGPGQSGEMAIAQDADQEGDGDEERGDEPVGDEPTEESGARGEGLAAMLEAHGRVRGSKIDPTGLGRDTKGGLATTSAQ